MIKKSVPLWVYIFVVALGLIVMALSSCSSPAKTARQNEKAYQRVITDSGMFRSIGQKWSRLQPPCTNDTIIGETQVLILSDTTVLPGTTDTIVRPDTIRITTTKVKKETQYIVDNRAIHELQDTIHAIRIRNAEWFGKNEQLTKDKQEQEKRAVLSEKRQRQLGWGIWGLIVLLLITHGLRSLPSLKKLL